MAPNEIEDCSKRYIKGGNKYVIINAIQLILQGNYFALLQYHGFGLKRLMSEGSAEQSSVFGLNALQSIPHCLILRKAFRRFDVSGGPRVRHGAHSI